MKNKDLILELENGREINVLLVAEEKYFMNLLALSNRYRNLNVKAIEKCDIYMSVLDDMKNIDIIINYREEKEDIVNIGQLTRLAFVSSLKNDNRVTVGYSYINNNSGIDNILVSSYKEENNAVEEIQIDNDYTPYDLLQIVLNEHDELEKVKVMKRS